MALAEELDKMDRLGGCTARSVIAMEAMWPDGTVPWSEAYAVARDRAREPGTDQNEGRTVAFLEGFLAAERLR